MADFQITIKTLRRTEADLSRQLESVRSAIAALEGSAAPGGRRGRRRGPGRPKGSGKRGRPKGRKMSAAARAKIAAAQKARWAKLKAGK
jgi:hypothetical protein